MALLCLLGLLVASPAIADSGIYYQLALVLLYMHGVHGRTQWPGAYCEQTSAGCCKPTTGVSPARDFYVSGFTVYNATTDAPVTGCNNAAPFDANEGLQQYWSSIRCPSNNGKSNWKNAWKKYGACSGLEEKDYFETALAFRSRINPLVRLKAKGIEPDFGLYGVKAIKKVFQAGIAATPVIQCSKGPFDKYQLYQLYFCAAEDGKFIDCPAPPQYTCSKEILFHPFKKWMLKQLQNEGADPFVLPGVAMEI
ncbi:S-like RNase [Panicum miliaceum]|uniref:S-like RNase n=1 Tax=Panicum miliaceum TaxID=4540 RepID=A0A3L6QMZ4_PANMI|nr:S-like RNase [Panicum miliaceum]